MNALARVGLMLAYAVLFLAAAGRSGVQLSTKASEAPLPYSLSAIAALLYGVIAFALWRASARWRKVALVGTSVELAGVLAVGAWGILDADAWPDETVWTGFGSGYAWVPLLLPIVALWALVRARRASPDAEGLPTEMRRS